MRDHLRDIGLIDRQGWIVIAMIGLGNAILLVGGLVGSPTFSLILLAALGFTWVVLLQVTRGIMWNGLELAQESSKEWQAEADFAREMLDEHLRTIHDLKHYDLQSTGVHLERLRRILVARHPELEHAISEVDHPVGRPGIII